MKYVEMKKVLNKLNKKWGLDFVSATSGNCCNTCGEMMTERATKAWEEAETYLVIKWFFKGMNYSGKFDEQDKLYIKYNLNDNVTIQEVCKGLKESLKGLFEVIEPEDNTHCIELIKIKNNKSDLMAGQKTFEI